MADETAPTKLKLDVGAAKAEARQQSASDNEQKTRREARWRQLFTASIEGAAVGLVDDLEEADEDEDEPSDEPIPSVEDQIRERAALTATAAAMLADFALTIEVQRGIC